MYTFLLMNSCIRGFSSKVLLNKLCERMLGRRWYTVRRCANTSGVWYAEVSP